MAKKKETYESKVLKLEEILLEMESREVTLDEAISKYEEGMRLYSDLYKTLQEAEGRIKILTDKGEEDFHQEN
ncbi:exodeoxyribonuclease VII small subunit [Clostridium sp. UBA1056]|jgi:exodeoxyribonuclease VII small subunit|uniref:exodeoxyribonuclease VII small subunit n=1 Tax=unclassified Clostridium TaxID=2614128 RepID=UPI003216AB97